MRLARRRGLAIQDPLAGDAVIQGSTLILE
jgi:hypothetical protein